MLSHWLPKIPAFASLRPAFPESVSVAPDVSGWLLNETRLNGDVRRLLTSAQPPFGHYLIIGKDSYFLKVLSVPQAEHHRQADAIAVFADKEGASALAPILWKETQKGPVIGVFPYVAGRYGEPVPSDTEKLGAALGKLHQALQRYPLSHAVRDASSKRNEMLEQRRQKMLSSGMLQWPDAEKTKALLALIEHPFDLPRFGQVIHGDLNLGNVIFGALSSEPVFIDFENSVVSWHSPGIDVGMVVQRFCLTADVPIDQKIDAVAAFLSRYQSSAGMRFSVEELVFFMRLISVRNICILGEVVASGRLISENECRKFTCLAKLAEDSADLLHDAMSRF